MRMALSTVVAMLVDAETSTGVNQTQLPVTLWPDTDLGNFTTGEPAARVVTVRMWVLAIGLFVTAILTFLGNMVVMISFYKEKKLLKSNFNIFIMNLTLTDIAVSVTAIPLFGVDYLLGKWPDVLGPNLCLIWIFCDWAMTFASMYTIVAISVDRYWAVCWCHHYKAHNTRRRTLLMVAFIWIAVCVVWIPAFVLDLLRVNKVKPNMCIWAVADNMYISVYMAVLGYHIPTVIIVFCYVKVFVVMRKSDSSVLKPRHPHVTNRHDRVNQTMTSSGLMTDSEYQTSEQTAVKPDGLTNNPPTKQADTAGTVTKSDAYQRETCFFDSVQVQLESNTDDDDDSSKTDLSQREQKCNSTLCIPLGSGSWSASYTKLSNAVSEKSGLKPRAREHSISSWSLDTGTRQIQKRLVEKTRTKRADRTMLQRPKNATSANGDVRTERGKSANGRLSRALQFTWQRKDTKLFIRVSYIIIAYLIFWLPFHIIFDLMIAGVEFHDDWYAFCALLCYLNSTINPLLYALGNPKMKAALKDTMSCKNFNKPSDE